MALRLVPVALTLALCVGCVGTRPVAPVILYGGSPRPDGDISVIRIVGERYPSIRIQTLSRVGASLERVYQAGISEAAWAPPDHFGGLQATQQQVPGEDPALFPREFHLIPGTYRVEFSYVPVVDRWGWTHIPGGESSTWLECEAGHVYLLEGRMNEEEDGWSLVRLVLVAGEG